VVITLLCNQVGTLAAGAPSLMFHRCSFRKRTYVALPASKTKLTFYACRFEQGQVAEIVFPFLGEGRDMWLRRFRGRQDVVAATPQAAEHFDRHDVDLRLTNCCIDGRLVVREHPWESDDYERRYGMGLNLCGSSISGVLHLNCIRIRWLNMDRVDILGGSIIMPPSGLVDRKDAWRRFAPFVIAAERCGVIFEERLLQGLEVPRFSSHILRTRRLVEFAHPENREREQYERIGDQYANLRNAFSRSPSSDWEEDYCHYKTMLYRSRAERLGAAMAGEDAEYDLTKWQKIKSGARGAAIWLFLLTAGCFLLRHILTAYGVDSRWKPLLVPAWIAGALAVYYLRERVRRVANLAFDELIFRRIIAYGVFATRPILVAPMMILAFAIVFWLPAQLRWTSIGDVVCAPGSFRVVDQAAGYELEPMAEISMAHDDEADVIQFIYFSAATFSTLDYGDFRPTKWLLWVAATEAITGGIMLAIVTICLARQFLRR
jgi:hypothetical protein